MIRLHKPTIKRKDMDAVLNCMVSEEIAPGGVNRELCQVLKRHFQAAEVHLLRSYPQAVEIALKASGAKRAGVSALAPGWYRHAAEDAGAQLLCLDIEDESLCPDREQLHGADCLLLHEPLGLFPQSGYQDELSIPIIEDISQSFGAASAEYTPGDAGALVILALEEDGMISSGGGAALIVKQRSLADPVQQLVDREGPLALLPDMNAALALTQYGFFEEHLKRRREFFELFYKSLLKTRHNCVAEMSEYRISSCWTFPVLLDSDIRSVLKFVRKYKVETSVAFERCLMMELELDRNQYPRSLPYVLRTVIFPLYPLLSQDQSKTLVRVLAALP